MRCEWCTRKLGRIEIIFGIRFGVVDAENDVFVPSKDSAATVICRACGRRVMELVYTKLNSNY